MATRLCVLVCAFVLLHCGHGAPLSQDEMNKLDPGLRQLLTQPGPSDASYDVSVRADGVKEYGVIIRSSSAQDLRDAGIQVGSIVGDIITARVSVEELRRIVSMPGVRAVEQANRSEVQH